MAFRRVESSGGGRGSEGEFRNRDIVVRVGPQVVVYSLGPGPFPGTNSYPCSGGGLSGGEAGGVGVGFGYVSGGRVGSVGARARRD